MQAGPDQELTAPVAHVILNGSASDPDGHIASYAWTKVSGTFSVLSGENTPTLSVSNMIGSHQFRLTVTDNFGENSADDITITVIPPPNNYNYVKESVIQREGILQETVISTLSVEEKNVSTTYFDGIGRPMQKVGWQISPATTLSPGKKDQIQPIVYDAFGREHRQYLPFVGNESNGAYKNNVIDASGNYTGLANNFYDNSADKIADDPKPYAQTIFEPSPLNRIAKQGAVGEAWQPTADLQDIADRSVKTKYELNGANEVLIMEFYEPKEELTSPGYYAANTLWATRTIDEHQNEIIEYKDKEGKVILKKVQYETINNIKKYAETYYVYDDSGNLIVVVPPEGVKKFNHGY